MSEVTNHPFDTIDRQHAGRLDATTLRNVRAAAQEKDHFDC